MGSDSWTLTGSPKLLWPGDGGGRVICGSLCAFAWYEWKRKARMIITNSPVNKGIIDEGIKRMGWEKSGDGKAKKKGGEWERAYMHLLRSQ